MLGNKLRVAVVGAGRLGCVVAAVLSRLHHVVLIDKNAKVITCICKGHVPFVEPGLDDSLKNVAPQTRYEVQDLDYIVICVDTPLRDDKICLRNLLDALRELIANIGNTQSNLSVAVCSTIPPQTMHTIIRPMLKPYVRNVAFIPEFLREGSAVQDYTFPTRFIVGASTLEEAKEFQNLRPDLCDVFHYCADNVAEMLKTTENCFHALKVAFANEVARTCNAIGVDGHTVMHLLSLDTRQNISSIYLRPGFAFGGSCLPKEVASMASFSSSTPLIHAILPSNDLHIEHCLDLIMSKYRGGEVGILGLSFKPGVDDIRGSPAIILAQRLSARVPVLVHDPLVSRDSLPDDLCRRMKPLDHVERCNLLVLTNGDEVYNSFKSLPNVINLSCSVAP
jgi:GDP-mannose 6-dehydrogenase